MKRLLVLLIATILIQFLLVVTAMGTTLKIRTNINAYPDWIVNNQYINSQFGIAIYESDTNLWPNGLPQKPILIHTTNFSSTGKLEFVESVNADLSKLYITFYITYVGAPPGLPPKDVNVINGLKVGYTNVEEEESLNLGPMWNPLAGLASSTSVSGPMVLVQGYGIGPGYGGSIAGDWIVTIDTQTVSIDIEPWFKNNVINPKYNSLLIPVAVLSTPTFNAPKSVELDSLTFGHSGSEKSLAFCSPISVDVDADKNRDLLCFFYTGQAAFKCGDTQGILKGKTKNGTPIEGSDSVRIIPCR